MKKSGRIYIKYHTHPVMVDDQLVQCWNCRAFGHISKKCAIDSRKGERNSLCPKCGELHPKDQKCSKLSCINCKKLNDKNSRKPGWKPLDVVHSCDNLKVCPVAKKHRAYLMETIYGSSTASYTQRF